MDRRSLRWLTEATDELAEIEAYIARRSVQYSRVVASRIALAPLILIDFPLAGSVAPDDKTDRHRQLREYSYRILYRVEEPAILIVGVIHGARIAPPNVFRRK